MRISFNTAAYVQVTTVQMDMIANGPINHWADGNENICTGIEELENVVADPELEPILKGYLNEVLEAIAAKSNGGSIGDVIFHK